MFCHFSSSKEEEWEVESLHRLHGPQQACLKDSFLLPSIYQMVNTTMGHQLLSFTDGAFVESTSVEYKC